MTKMIHALTATSYRIVTILHWQKS